MSYIYQSLRFHIKTLREKHEPFPRMQRKDKSALPDWSFLKYSLEILGMTFWAVMEISTVFYVGHNFKWAASA